jgi:Zn-dependent protease with chaperone function
MLRALARDTIYDLRIIDVPQAFAGLHGKAVLLISLPALQLLSGKELQAIAAHEVGHEYFWEEYEVAKIQKDEQRLRELEMACDTIAILTLLRLRLPPDPLISALEKLFWFNRRRFGVALNESRYPLLRDRGEAIERLTAREGLTARTPR